MKHSLASRSFTGVVITCALALPTFSASPAGADIVAVPVYNQLTFTITTGSSAVRTDSTVTAIVSLPSGPQTFALKAQGGEGWPVSSTHTQTVSLQGAPVPMTGFGAITIGLTSHNAFGETDNVWNVNTVTLSAKAGTGPMACVVNQSGNPLARLTGSTPTVVLKPGTGC